MWYFLNNQNNGADAAAALIAQWTSASKSGTGTTLSKDAIAAYPNHGNVGILSTLVAGTGTHALRKNLPAAASIAAFRVPIMVPAQFSAGTNGGGMAFLGTYDTTGVRNGCFALIAKAASGWTLEVSASTKGVLGTAAKILALPFGQWLDVVVDITRSSVSGLNDTWTARALVLGRTAFVSSVKTGVTSQDATRAVYCLFGSAYKYTDLAGTVYYGPITMADSYDQVMARGSLDQSTENQESGAAVQINAVY